MTFKSDNMTQKLGGGWFLDKPSLMQAGFCVAFVKQGENVGETILRYELVFLNVNCS